MITLVGIVGGIGSGKSAVTDQFRQLGAEVLDGDRLGHQVLDDPAVIETLRERWGEQIIASGDTDSASASIDRSQIAKIVFAGTPQAEMELRYLEELTHPRIRKLIASRMETLRQQYESKNEPLVVILDAPLLLEAGWNELCSHLIYVEVPRHIRLERLASRGWNAADLASREARQLPLAEKRAHADWIIDNSGPLEKLSTQIQPIWGSLTLPKTP
jgi:dephospho-CoA kinase